MIRARISTLRIVSSISSSLVALVCLSFPASGQDLLVQSPSAPPPLKFISSTEQARLVIANDSKSRLKTSIQMAETRLLRAEQFTVDRMFIAATSELGVYQALIEDALLFLGKQKQDSNKTRDLYKRLEIQLRLHSMRIESIRRVTPVAFAVHVKTIWNFSDSARMNAINGFFSDIVLTQPVETSQAASDKIPSKETSPSAPVSPSKEQP